MTLLPGGYQATLGFSAPVHALINGRADERDRRVALVTAPRFGIVNQSQIVAFKIEDSGVPALASGTGQPIRRDGEAIDQRTVRIRRATVRGADPDSPRSGPNIVEIARNLTPLENELTTVNNRAVVSIDGVRDKLRVLLVSGEPACRANAPWPQPPEVRRQRRSSIIFTISCVRPKNQDGTPINELSR